MDPYELLKEIITILGDIQYVVHVIVSVINDHNSILAIYLSFHRSICD